MTKEYIIKDPHHDGYIEWKYQNGQFYQRMNTATESPRRKWTFVKRIHLTPARVKALASLVEMVEKENGSL